MKRPLKRSYLTTRAEHPRCCGEASYIYVGRPINDREIHAVGFAAGFDSDSQPVRCRLRIVGRRLFIIKILDSEIIVAISTSLQVDQSVQCLIHFRQLQILRKGDLLQVV